MNLHAIAVPVISAVNPQIQAGFFLSTGGVEKPDGTVVPSFANAVLVSAQVQELTASDLRQMDGVNLQDHVVAIYLYGSADGVNRAAGTGGDLVAIPSGTRSGVYLVSKVLERWPDWTKVAATLQLDPISIIGTLDYTDPANSQFFPGLQG